MSVANSCHRLQRIVAGCRGLQGCRGLCRLDAGRRDLGVE